VIERLAVRHGTQLDERRVSPVSGRPAGVAGRYQDGPERVELLMPLTMMNESGAALEGVGVPLQDLLLVCDDVNLPLGVIRLRAEGGAGGHHGLRSCLEALKTEQVPRLRIGVCGGALPKELRDYVLAPFPSAERPLVRQAIEQAADACEAWVREGVDAAMNRCNRP
jgi:PTH1 family peptidyl-tRNA hydrolase